jgi:hypothetical protein
MLTKVKRLSSRIFRCYPLSKTAIIRALLPLTKQYSIHYYSIGERPDRNPISKRTPHDHSRRLPPDSDRRRLDLSPLVGTRLYPHFGSVYRARTVLRREPLVFVSRSRPNGASRESPLVHAARTGAAPPGKSSGLLARRVCRRVLRFGGVPPVQPARCDDSYVQHWATSCVRAPPDRVFDHEHDTTRECSDC